MTSTKLSPWVNKDISKILTSNYWKLRPPKIICFPSGNLLEGLFFFLIANTRKYHFSFKRLFLTGHFHFLYFIFFFQTLFSVFSSSFDASTYFQIETPSSYLVLDRNWYSSAGHRVLILLPTRFYWSVWNKVGNNFGLRTEKGKNEPVHQLHPDNLKLQIS